MQTYIFYGLLFLFIVLNILDAHSTISVIKKGSYKNEKNPFARFFIKRFGAFKGVIYVKSLLLIILPLMVYYFYNDSLSITIVLAIACAAYIFVVINNYRLAKRLRRKKEFTDYLNKGNYNEKN